MRQSPKKFKKKKQFRKENVHPLQKKHFFRESRLTIMVQNRPRKLTKVILMCQPLLEISDLKGEDGHFLK